MVAKSNLIDAELFQKLVESLEEAAVLRRSAKRFPRTEPADVFASLPSTGKTRTINEMKAGVLVKMKRRNRD